MGDNNINIIKRDFIRYDQIHKDWVTNNDDIDGVLIVFTMNDETN